MIILPCSAADAGRQASLQQSFCDAGARGRFQESKYG